MSAPTHPPTSTCVCTACNPSARKTAYEQVIEGLEARLNTAFQRIEQLERDVAKLKTYTRLPEAKWMCADCGTCFATTEHVVSHICEPQP